MSIFEREKKARRAGSKFHAETSTLREAAPHHAPSASPTPVSVGHGTPLATRTKTNTARAKTPDYWWAMKMGIGTSPAPKPVAVSGHVQLELEPVDPSQPVTEQLATKSKPQSVSARCPPRRRKRRPGHRYHPRTRRAPQRYTQPSFPYEYGDTPITLFIPERTRYEQRQRQFQRRYRWRHYRDVVLQQRIADWTKAIIDC